MQRTTFFFCGDVVPAGAISYQDQFIENSFLKKISSYDYRIGTLECAVGTGLPFDKGKMSANRDIIWARNEDFFRIRKLGLNVVSLANNHVFDLGHDGLRNTRSLLEESGIQYCGAGDNIQEASSPAVLHTKNGTVAIFGCAFKGLKPVSAVPATDTMPGIWQTNIETVCARIRDAKSSFDYVFVMPHWGIELSYFPPETEYQYSRAMIDAGADAILASHTHVVGPIWQYKGKLICHSMGNFLFPDFPMDIASPMYFPSTCEEYAQLPRMFFYPHNMTTPVVSVWRKKSRVGWGIVLHVNNGTNRIRFNTFFSNLTENNILQQLKGISNVILRIRTTLWKMLFEHFSYSFTMRCIKSKYNIIGRLFNRCSVCKKNQK